MTKDSIYDDVVTGIISDYEQIMEILQKRINNLRGIASNSVISVKNNVSGTSNIRDEIKRKREEILSSISEVQKGFLDGAKNSIPNMDMMRSRLPHSNMSSGMPAGMPTMPHMPKHMLENDKAKEVWEEAKKKIEGITKKVDGK